MLKKFGLFSFKILIPSDRQERCVLLSLHLVKERKRSASAIALLIKPAGTLLKREKLVIKIATRFRLSFSTGACLTFLMDYIRSKMYFGNYIGMVMIDPQKAFYTVDKSILKNKLKAMDLDGNAITWFDAYLTNMMQVTDVGGISLTPGLYHRDPSWGHFFWYTLKWQAQLPPNPESWQV